jgi:hypothetical protein
VQRGAAEGTALDFIGSGITHPSFLATIGKLGPGLREKLEAVAPVFC